jgi:hypothetical protein
VTNFIIRKLKGARNAAVPTLASSGITSWLIKKFIRKVLMKRNKKKKNK